MFPDKNKHIDLMLCVACVLQRAGGRGPADASVPADVWRLSAEHRRQVLPEGHRAILARRLSELRPLRLSPRRGRPTPLLQAGEKIMSERLPQVRPRPNTKSQFDLISQQD